MENLQEILGFLGKNRSASSEAFQERLKKAGFIIEYGHMDYWDCIPYIQIGDEEIYLQESRTINRNTSCCWRKQNDIIDDILYSIRVEHKRLQENDKQVEIFFNKLIK